MMFMCQGHVEGEGCIIALAVTCLNIRKLGHISTSDDAHRIWTYFNANSVLQYICVMCIKTIVDYDK